MKIYRLLFLYPFLLLLASCNGQDQPNYKYSEKETQQFLDEIVKNAEVVIGDITEIEKKSTNELYLVTRYPLSESKLAEYDKNNGSIINKNDDISDFTTYIFKGYELVNEKNERLQFVEDGRAVYLQEGPLWAYNNIECRKLGIEMKLNKKYEKLNGYITIEFEMPKNMFGKIKREARIPVNITIYDKPSE